MNSKQLVLARLNVLIAQPRWKYDRKPLVDEAVEDLSDCGDELLDVVLTETEEVRMAAYECLCVMTLPVSVIGQLETVATCGHDADQVAWSLLLLAENEYTDPLDGQVVERAFGLGGIGRLAAIGAIPYVDDDDSALETWLEEIFEEGDEIDRMKVMDAAFRVSTPFAATLIERACIGTELKVASDALYLSWYADLDRDRMAGLVGNALDRWPAETSILLPALYCIKDLHLQEFEDLVASLIHHESGGIALQAAEALVELSPVRAQRFLEEHSASLHEAVRVALREAASGTDGSIQSGEGESGR